MDIVEATYSRLAHAIELIEKYLESDSKKNHSHFVLTRLVEILATRQDQLGRLSSDTSLSVRQTACLTANEKLDSTYWMIGFCVRAIDIRNAFELHAPFLRLVKRALGDEARLVISSEWEFSPHTYRHTRGLGLDDVVFIGMPASEASNALTVPLAGHELGHNIWRKAKLTNMFHLRIAECIVEHIRNEVWDEFLALFSGIGQPDQLTDMVGQQSWADAWRFSLHQAEELFCDYIGVLIFGSSFVESFVYLLSPGSEVRSPSYPSDRDRIVYQYTCAKKRNITIPEGCEDQFIEQSLPRLSDQEKFLLRISDSIVKQFADDIEEEAYTFLSDRGLLTNSDSTEEALTCFALGVPVLSPVSIAQVLGAAWKFSSDGYREWKDRYPTIYNDNSLSLKMLSDLVFKSLEVLEIENRLQAPEHHAEV